MATFSRRYASGDRDAVWRELGRLGPRALDDPFREDTDEVARLMAVRARHNCLTIIDRLHARGFTAKENDAQRSPRPAFVPATSDARDLAVWLDDTFGPIPRTVAAWIREVGDIWLVGSIPDWVEAVQADPLVVEFEYSTYGMNPRAFYEGERDAWRDMQQLDSELDPFRLDFAPDRLHKANISGGAPTGVVVPSPTADGLVHIETGRSMMFVRYLDSAFRSGGFPYLDVRAPAGFREELARDIMPL